MRHEKHGWVVQNTDHPNTSFDFMNDNTFAYTKKEAIEKFIEGSGKPWKHWHDKLNYRCVRATMTIVTY